MPRIKLKNQYFFLFNTLLEHTSAFFRVWDKTQQILETLQNDSMKIDYCDFHLTKIKYIYWNLINLTTKEVSFRMPSRWLKHGLLVIFRKFNQMLTIIHTFLKYKITWKNLIPIHWCSCWSGNPWFDLCTSYFRS